jgi:hypothetical protein
MFLLIKRKVLMNIDHPILVIVTNRDCSHCITMRGKNGWPSDGLPYSISSLQDDPSDKKWRWDKKFLKLFFREEHINQSQDLQL